MAGYVHRQNSGAPTTTRTRKVRPVRVRSQRLLQWRLPRVRSPNGIVVRVGRLGERLVRRYVYDAWNRLIKVQSSKNSGAVPPCRSPLDRSLRADSRI